MAELSQEVTFIQEERSEHFHVWLLPRYEWIEFPLLRERVG
jgi:hypothetical protein